MTTRDEGHDADGAGAGARDADESRRLRGRLAVLSETMRAFAEATVDVPRLLDTIARRLAEAIRGGCIVRLLSEDGTQLEPVAMDGLDPAAVARMRATLATPLRLDEHPALRAVIETGVPLLASRKEVAPVPQAAAGYADLVEANRVESFLIVALRAQGRSLGTLTMARSSASPPFDEQDRDLTQTLADHAALAIVNARLIEASRRELLELTERRRVEAELREQRAADAKFRGLLEAAPDAMVVVDRDGRMVIVNGRVEALFGYEREELIGQPVDALIPERFRDAQALIRDRCLAADRRPPAGSIELCGVRKDGTEFPTEVSFSRLDTADGVLVSSAIRDVTDRKAVEDALRLANSEIEELSRSVAHDLRSPLRGMSGAAHVLIEAYREKLDAEALAWLDDIRSNALRMGSLIDGLLALSRVTRLELRREWINLSSIVAEAAAELPRVEGRSVEVAIQPGLRADVDPPLVRLLLDNLLENAWKFTSTVASPRIEVGELDAGGGPVFFVRDNGIGFDMAFGRKLFTAFEKLHAARDLPGVGVGLAIVHRIVSRHGGRIWAESDEGAGATFYFTLPHRRPSFAPLRAPG